MCKPLLVSYWDLLGSTFTASGQAKNVYCVVEVKQGKCLIKRQKDGFEVSIDTQRLLNLLNQPELEKAG